MKILVINAGSSTLKYQLFDMTNESILAKGNCENIGLHNSKITSKAGDKKHEMQIDIPNHEVAFSIVIKALTEGELKVIDDIKEISAFGHRVVHGKNIIKPLLVTPENLEEVRKLKDYAPLHIPGSLKGIEGCLKMAPEIPNILVFDTSYHATIPQSIATYAIPQKYIEEYGIRKYGFHGSSHKYIASEVERMTGRKDLKIVNCHLGSGASICAIKDGKSVDTSMGFTPLAGLVMGTRSGDIDPAIVGFLADKLNKPANEIIDILNYESGLKGLCGSSDSRFVEEGVTVRHDPVCEFTFDVMENSVLKYIGSYIAELGGIDVLVFTAGVGENSPILRERLLEKLSYLNITFDKEINNKTIRKSENTLLSLPDSKVLVYVIPTNEELVIARDTLEELQKNK